MSSAVAIITHQMIDPDSRMISCLESLVAAPCKEHKPYHRTLMSGSIAPSRLLLLVLAGLAHQPDSQRVSIPYAPLEKA
jgi:hypothetical protein